MQENDEIEFHENDETSEDVLDEKFEPSHLKEAIDGHDREKLTKIFDLIPDADIAEAAEELSIAQLLSLFREAPSSKTAPVFDELSQSKKEELVNALKDKDLVSLIAAQEPDDLADTVGDMPANLAKKVLDAAPKEMRKDVNRLLKFKEGTAGAIMTTEYLEVRDSLTVKETADYVRARGREAETIYTIFVRDAKNKFVGTLDLDDLIFASGETKIADIINRDAPYCHASTDQEEVANMFRRYDVNAMAVLNDDDCLTGIVTFDDAMDVIAEEANEDIANMNAVSNLDDAYLETHPTKMAKKCVPWIIILLILGTFSSMVLSVFQDSLSVVPVLAAFIPVLMDTGGNAGGQTIALMIRGLALKEFEPKQFWKIVLLELRSALLISAAIAVFAFFWFTLEQYTGIVHNTEADIAIGNPDGWATIWNGQCWSWPFFIEVTKVSGVVSGTLFITTIVSKLIAVILPLGTAALKKDPAIVSQPLLTTIVDVTSLLIFFGIAQTVITSLI